MQNQTRQFTKLKWTYNSSNVGSSVPLIYVDDRLRVTPGYENVSGDRSTPNNIEYTRQYFRCWDGRRTRLRLADGRLDQTIEGNWGSYPPSFTFDLTTVDSNVYNDCLSKVFDRIRGEVDLSVDILEGGQTRRMIRDALKTLSYVRRFHPSDLRTWYREFKRYPPGSARALGSRWLEFQYGWKPLAQDIYEAGVELQRFLPRLFVIKERAKQVNVFTASSVFDAESGIPVTCRVENSHRVEICGHFQFKPSLVQFLSNFTSLNPVSMAWELTPYSFVVDWFLDVGGYLRNLESACLLGQMFKSGYRTYTNRVRSEHLYLASSKDTGGYSYVYDFKGGLRIDAWKKRERLTSIPYPRPPRFKADLGSVRLLNLAALLSQHLRG